MAPPRTLKNRVLATLPALDGAVWRTLSGGRTNRLWRVGDTVIKAYDPDAGSPLFPNESSAEAQALSRFGPLSLSPVLEHSGEGWIAYRFVEGAPWRSDPARVAALLHRLHSTYAPGFRVLPSGSGAILAQARAILAGCTGRIASAPEDPGIPPVDQTCPLHGDAVPGNIVDGPGGLTLIDWQCPASGDPTEDLATFLSPAMQRLYRGAILLGSGTRGLPRRISRPGHRRPLPRAEISLPLAHGRPLPLESRTRGQRLCRRAAARVCLNRSHSAPEPNTDSSWRTYRAGRCAIRHHKVNNFHKERRACTTTGSGAMSRNTPPVCL